MEERLKKLVVYRETLVWEELLQVSMEVLVVLLKESVIIFTV